jgi:hypothetical protein
MANSLRTNRGRQWRFRMRVVRFCLAVRPGRFLLPTSMDARWPMVVNPVAQDSFRDTRRPRFQSPFPGLCRGRKRHLMALYSSLRPVQRFSAVLYGLNGQRAYGRRRRVAIFRPPTEYAPRVRRRAGRAARLAQTTSSYGAENHFTGL